MGMEKFFTKLMHNESLLPHILRELDSVDSLDDLELENILETLFELRLNTKKKYLRRCIDTTVLVLLSKFSDLDTLKEYLAHSVIDLEFEELDPNWKPVLSEYINSLDSSPRLELLKAYIDSSYRPNITLLAEYKAKSKKEQRYFDILLSFIGKRFYKLGELELATTLLELQSESYEKYWNLHIIVPQDNRIIVKLLPYIDNDVLQLELLLKYYENLTVFEENWTYLKLRESIYKELLEKVGANVSDELLSAMYLEKLYYYELFLPIEELFSGVNHKKMRKADLVSVYKSFKSIYEFLKDNKIGYKTAILRLADIDHVLFSELKDEDSAVSFMINNIMSARISNIEPNLDRLSFLIREDSIASDIILETFISKHFALNKLKGIGSFIKKLQKSKQVFFRVSGYLLDSFRSTRMLMQVPAIVQESKQVFKRYPQLFYIYLTELFSFKLNPKELKRFFVALLFVDLGRELLEQVFYALLNYLYEQPYIDFLSQFNNYKITGQDRKRVEIAFDTFVLKLLGEEDIPEEFVYSMPRFIELMESIIGRKNVRESV